MIVDHEEATRFAVDADCAVHEHRPIGIQEAGTGHPHSPAKDGSRFHPDRTRRREPHDTRRRFFPALRCELKRDNGIATLRVDGELEEISAVELARACLYAREASGDVILDLGGIAFADGTGTRMIATMQRVFRRSGHRLTIVNVPARMRQEAELLEPDDDALRIAS